MRRKEIQMAIFPHCNRPLRPAPRKANGVPKELRNDLLKAEKAIQACHNALNWPNEHVSFYRAVRDEIARLTLATKDYRLLWRIYRRNSKTPSYALARRRVAA
jgi:hypothetical protein